jgi:hypothetical protein
MNQELLWRRGVSVGNQHCILSAWGNGISGRIYGEGLHISRYVVLDLYVPATCFRKNIQVTMLDFEALFASPGLQALLTGGRKDILIHTLAKMLVLEKGPSNAMDGKTKPLAEGDSFAGEEVKKVKTTPGEGCGATSIDIAGGKEIEHTEPMMEAPDILRVSPRQCERPSAAEARREGMLAHIRERRLARIRAQDLWQNTPKHKRGAIVIQGMRVSGFCVVGAVFEFSTRPNYLLIRVYSPQRSTTFELPIGAREAGKVLDMALPSMSEWSSDLKRGVCLKLLEKVTFRHAENPDEMSLLLYGREGITDVAIYRTPATALIHRISGGKNTNGEHSTPTTRKRSSDIKRNTRKRHAEWAWHNMLCQGATRLSDGSLGHFRFNVNLNL